MRTPSLEDFCLGQYKASISKDGKSRIFGYLEEPGVYPNSLTPTFVAGVLYIDNARWDGVPFLIKAGYGLIKHKCVTDPSIPLYLSIYTVSCVNFWQVTYIWCPLF